MDNDGRRESLLVTFASQQVKLTDIQLWLGSAGHHLWQRRHFRRRLCRLGQPDDDWHLL